MWFGVCSDRALNSPPLRFKLGVMEKWFSGLFGFTLCLLIGILLGQVALGILAGLFLGAFSGTRKGKAPEESSDA